MKGTVTVALTPEESVRVQTAMSQLRAMGCAVCIFMPEDVESAAENVDRHITPQAAAEWLIANRRHIEDGMSTIGNQYISDNIDRSES